ncbi:hypothetical protein [Corynebacterium cystitidis]|uniref:Uncharacterized protein n=1 Tax=Corynebacterium cystitidis DSM 20524 TaxID=1121357 RepID=A0A1H9PT91_9CORY|nr:hypothetical protein [Corynebacterium cystitidis]WJY82390.1 hypothetical protein CCYS_07330 [Corynebacterium cystitidis DSM 20524]SER51437.1 hypothetical protein SAMN05661109_00452 [Corynebacterium cystitidis DSM 20524]SNV76023.1 Uncharacterised protein [Corynebacterium cystitidis]
MAVFATVHTSRNKATGATEQVQAVSYEILGHRVVQLVTDVAPAVAVVSEVADSDPTVTAVGYAEPQSDEYPAWAITHYPEFTRDAVTSMQETAWLRRNLHLSATKLKKRAQDTGAALAETAAQIAPLFLEEAARILADNGKLKEAQQLFGQARKIERDKNLDKDPQRHAKAMREFARLGAIGAREISAEAKTATFDELLELNAYRLNAKHTPHKRMLAELRKAAKADRLDPQAAELAIAEALAPTPGFQRAGRELIDELSPYFSQLSNWRELLRADFRDLTMKQTFEIWENTGLLDKIRANPKEHAAWVLELVDSNMASPHRNQNQDGLILEIRRAQFPDGINSPGSPEKFEPILIDVVHVGVLNELLAQGIPLQYAPNARTFITRLPERTDNRMGPATRLDTLANDEDAMQLVYANYDHYPQGWYGSSIVQLLQFEGGIEVARLALERYLAQQEQEDATALASQSWIKQRKKSIETMALATLNRHFPELVDRLLRFDPVSALARRLRTGHFAELTWPTYEHAMSEMLRKGHHVDAIYVHSSYPGVTMMAGGDIAYVEGDTLQWYTTEQVATGNDWPRCAWKVGEDIVIITPIGSTYDVNSVHLHWVKAGTEYEVPVTGQFELSGTETSFAVDGGRLTASGFLAEGGTLETYRSGSVVYIDGAYYTEDNNSYFAWINGQWAQVDPPVVNGQHKGWVSEFTVGTPEWGSLCSTSSEKYRYGMPEHADVRTSDGAEYPDEIGLTAPRPGGGHFLFTYSYHSLRSKQVWTQPTLAGRHHLDRTSTVATASAGDFTIQLPLSAIGNLVSRDEAASRALRAIRNDDVRRIFNQPDKKTIASTIGSTDPVIVEMVLRTVTSVHEGLGGMNPSAPFASTRAMLDSEFATLTDDSVVTSAIKGSDLSHDLGPHGAFTRFEGAENFPLAAYNAWRTVEEKASFDEMRQAETILWLAGNEAAYVGSLLSPVTRSFMPSISRWHEWISAMRTLINAGVLGSEWTCVEVDSATRSNIQAPGFMMSSWGAWRNAYVCVTRLSGDELEGCTIVRPGPEAALSAQQFHRVLDVLEQQLNTDHAVGLEAMHQGDLAEIEARTGLTPNMIAYQLCGFRWQFLENETVFGFTKAQKETLWKIPQHGRRNSGTSSAVSAKRLDFRLAVLPDQPEDFVRGRLNVEGVHQWWLHLTGQDQH